MLLRDFEALGSTSEEAACRRLAVRPEYRKFGRNRQPPKPATLKRQLQNAKAARRKLQGEAKNQED
jgi:hypothetical protein